MGNQGVVAGTSTPGNAPGQPSFEIPPGGTVTINISNVSSLYFIATNSTDIITGWAEALI
jgi:hypothetical protein